MTQEHPERAGTAPVFCENCHTAVRLERDDQSLVLQCACGETLGITPDDALPLKWERGSGLP